MQYTLSDIVIAMTTYQANQDVSVQLTAEVGDCDMYAPWLQLSLHVFVLK